MADSEVQRLIDGLAERLRRSVVIDDPAVRLLYTSRHYGDEDEVRTHAVLQRRASSAAVGHVLAQGVAGWTRAGVIPPLPEIGMRARVCHPVRWRGALIGLLLVVDADGSITTSELGEITRVGDEVAPLLVAEGDGEATRAADAREAATRDLLGATHAVRRDAVRELAGLLDVDAVEHVRVLHVEVRTGGGARSAGPRVPGSAHVGAALRFALAEHGGDAAAPVTLTCVGEAEAHVVLGSPREVGDTATERHAAQIVRSLESIAADRFVSVVGVGGPVRSLDRAWASARQARLASGAARGVVADRVVQWTALGATGTLLQLPPGALDPDLLPDELQRLLAADRDGSLVESVRQLLAHAGSMPATATALHIHRTTLYYRLDRVRQLTGLDLDDGRTRLALHVGLSLLDLAAFDKEWRGGATVASE